MAEIIWKTKEEMDEEAEENAWISLRAERDRLLVASDWTQLPDVALSNEDKLIWQAYRQALRDVPQQEGAPWDVVWPEAPNVGG